MSGLDLLLKDAKGYELTHQLILNTLLNNNEFREILLNIDDPTLKVKWEYHRGFFDLALVKNIGNVEHPVCCIEIKMWSGLGDHQRNKQKDFIKQHGIKGAHILLGTSDLEYLKTDTDDQLSDLTEGFSQKIGYTELLKALSEYLKTVTKNSDEYDLIDSYLKVLVSQQKYLNDACYQKDDVYLGHYYYSVFKRLQDRINGIITRIYTVNNRGGAVYIINDQSSWFNITYKEEKFQLYQEILNNNHEIRLYAFPESTIGVKRELAALIRGEIQQSHLNKHNYNYLGKASKYMILAKKELLFENTNDLKFEADLFTQTHDILREISRNIK